MTCETMEDKESKEYGYSEPIVLELPSSSEYILLARLVVSCVGQLAEFEPEDIYDMKLAVTEAATNVIRHAAVGSFHVEYRVLPRAVEITVVDEGGGFDVAGLTGKPGEHGGFGLAVIRSLVDEVVLDSIAGGGTRLSMIRRATPPAQTLEA
ncbi:MAG: serine/threonine-protein kinase RsbW [Rubrobacteraceae bacterium]|jgi:serine/threonine-protein kinase RsbW|nr:serine/threonine-protein kinase RsbW [Rubrobacteraceae bacterium]